MFTAKKRLSLLRFLVITIFIIHIPTWTEARAQGPDPATVRVTPNLIQVNAGGTGDLAIEVVDVQGLYGFDLQVAFNPSVVEIVDEDHTIPGVQVLPGDFLDAGFVAFNEVDNVTGTLHFVMTQLNPSQPKSGTGILIRFRVHGLLGGTSTPIAPTFAELADQDGAALPVGLQPGRAEITGTPGAHPTNTLAPTPGGTTTPPTLQPSPTQAGTDQPGYPEPTEPGYPEPESPTPPAFPTQDGGYPAAETTAPALPTVSPVITLKLPTEIAELDASETVTLTPTSEAPQPAAEPRDAEAIALLETAVILVAILVLAVSAIFIFIQLTRSV